MTTKDERKLLSEDPLLVLPTLAKALGLNAAIMAQQIHYWLTINEAKESNFKDGYYWTFNSIGKWQKQFPFWSENTIERVLRKLNDKGIVVTGRYNKRNFDRTKWYRLDYAKLIEACPLDHNGQIQWTKKVQPLHQNDLMGEASHCSKMTSPIPETNITENTTETNGTIKKKATTVKDESSYQGNTPLRGKRNYPSGKPQATNELASLADKGTGNEPIPRSAPPPSLGDTIEAFLLAHGSSRFKDIKEYVGAPQREVSDTLKNDPRFKFLGMSKWNLSDATNPLAQGGSPALKSQNDSPESHPGASGKVKVEPVSVFSGRNWGPFSCMAADPATTDRLKRILGLDDMEDVLSILDYGQAEGRPESLEGNLETILFFENPDDNTLKAIKAWLDTTITANGFVIKPFRNKAFETKVT